MRKLNVLAHNVKQAAIALDQLANALIGLAVSVVCLLPFFRGAGLWWADETVSAHCWRWHIMGVRHWPWKLVDGLAALLGDKEHCRESFESERLGRQLPVEERAS